MLRRRFLRTKHHRREKNTGTYSCVCACSGIADPGAACCLLVVTWTRLVAHTCSSAFSQISRTLEKLFASSEQVSKDFVWKMMSTLAKQVCHLFVKVSLSNRDHSLFLGRLTQDVNITGRTCHETDVRTGSPSYTLRLRPFIR